MLLVNTVNADKYRNPRALDSINNEIEEVQIQKELIKLQMAQKDNQIKELNVEIE